MAQNVIIGLERLLNELKWQELCVGNIAYLSHSAAITRDLTTGLSAMKNCFGKRLKKVFGPQHGFVTDVQDNMVETDHTHHPYFDLPIYSLYGETRSPNQKMLSGIDTLIIDLQDVGTRVYTYITTMSLAMEKCNELGIRVVVLDRPNPVGGLLFEGPVLQKKWKSFVGHHPIPQRHSLTIAEVAILEKLLHCPDVDLHIVPMKNWKRSYLWKDTGLPWVNPSPNLSTPESALTFCGSVLYEGTNISEGRGTTRALEVLGAPGIEPFSFVEQTNKELQQLSQAFKDQENKEFNFFDGFRLRPIQFFPMFQKFSRQACGGFHIHPQNSSSFLSWHLGAYLLRIFKASTEFKWNDAPYEYETGFAINYINGGIELKDWVDKEGSIEEFLRLSTLGHDEFKNLRDDVLIY